MSKKKPPTVPTVPSIPIALAPAPRARQEIEAEDCISILYPGGHSPTRTYFVHSSPFLGAFKSKPADSETSGTFHVGKGLTAAQVIAAEAASWAFDARPSADGFTRCDRLVWDGEVLVGVLLNILRRPEWFGGDLVALEILPDRDMARIVRIPDAGPPRVVREDE